MLVFVTPITQFVRTFAQVAKNPAEFVLVTWEADKARSRRSRFHLGPIEYDLAGSLFIIEVWHYLLKSYVRYLPLKTTASDHGTILRADAFGLVYILDSIYRSWEDIFDEPAFVSVLGRALFCMAFWLLVKTFSRRSLLTLYDSYAVTSYTWGTFCMPAMLVLHSIATVTSRGGQLQPESIDHIPNVTYWAAIVLLIYVMGTSTLMMTYQYKVVAGIRWGTALVYVTVLQCAPLLVGLNGAAIWFLVCCSMFFLPIVAMLEDSERRSGRGYVGRVFAALCLGWFLVAFLTSSQNVVRQSGSGSGREPGEPRARFFATLLWSGIVSRLVWIKLRPSDRWQGGFRERLGTPWQVDREHLVELTTPAVRMKVGTWRSETLWAEKWHDGTYEIQSIPVVWTNVRLGDRVTIAHEGPDLVIEKIVVDGGHRTAVVRARRSPDESPLKELIRDLVLLRCTIERGEYFVLGLDVPADVDGAPILNRLDEAQRRRWIDVEWPGRGDRGGEA